MKLDHLTRDLLKRKVNLAMRAKHGIGGQVEHTPGVCLRCGSSYTKNPKAAKQFYCTKACGDAARKARDAGDHSAHIEGVAAGTCAASDCDNEVIVGKFSRREKRFCSKTCSRRDWTRRKTVDSRACHSNAVSQTASEAGSGEMPGSATSARTPKPRPSPKASPSAAASYASAA